MFPDLYISGSFHYLTVLNSPVKGTHHLEGESKFMGPTPGERLAALASTHTHTPQIIGTSAAFYWDFSTNKVLVKFGTRQMSHTKVH